MSKTLSLHYLINKVFCSLKKPTHDNTKGPFGIAISKSAISNHDFKMCDLKKVIFKNAVKRLAKLQFSI